MSVFGFKQPEDSPGFLLWQLSTKWQKQIKRILSEYDLNHPQFVILAILQWCKENEVVANQNYIISKTQLDKMTVSNNLKILIEKKMIKRASCKDDTRAKLVNVTSKATKLLENLVPKIEASDKALFKALNKHHLQQMIGHMQLLNASS